MARGDTTDQARAVAHALGVSERTAWRRFAAARKSGSLDPLTRPRHCEWCSKRLPTNARTDCRFCDGTCRVAHHRHKDDPSSKALPPGLVWPD